MIGNRASYRRCQSQRAWGDSGREKSHMQRSPSKQPCESHLAWVTPLVMRESHCEWGWLSSANQRSVASFVYLLQCVSNSRVTLRVSDTASLCVSNARPISAQWHRFGRCRTNGGRGLSTEVIQATKLHHLQQKLNSTNVNINFHKTRGFHVEFTASERICANMSISKIWTELRC